MDEINHGSFDDPQMQMMLVQLADRLAKAKGKKQYGYLNAGTKKLVDAIVAKLAGDSRIQELYSLWYEQKEDVLRTYTNKMPDRIPLEQEKEFKPIRNAVVQAALQLQLPQEELPLSDPVPPCVDFVDDGSDEYPKAVESLREPEVEPAPEVKQFLDEAAIRGSVDPQRAQEFPKHMLVGIVSHIRKDIDAFLIIIFHYCSRHSSAAGLTVLTLADQGTFVSHAQHKICHLLSLSIAEHMKPACSKESVMSDCWFPLSFRHREIQSMARCFCAWHRVNAASSRMTTLCAASCTSVLWYAWPGSLSPVLR